MTLGEIGEFGLISRMVSGLGQGSRIRLGPGDDCAVVGLSGDLVISTDTMVQGVHWKDSWSAAGDVGRKLVAASVADIEAMGADPVALVVSLAAPPQTSLDWLDGFRAGLVGECDTAGVSLVGGDTTSADIVVLTSTVIGDLGGRHPITRSGAQPGQVVAEIGRLGWAEAGLAVLNRGFRSPAAVVRAHRVPATPYGQGRVAAEFGAGAMIDVSDGLIADLGHIAAESGVRVELDRAAFEITDAQQVVGAALGGQDPLNFVFGGGDDHALVATFAADSVPPGWRVIGRVVAGEPEVLVDGEVWTETAGWQHF